jgi:hypothetical protein
MQSSAWIALLRRIPPDQQDTLAIMTTVGIEINLQAILRLEGDYVVIRGRLAGTTDTGRVFFVPFGQINYLGFTREVREPQIRALYGEAPAAAEMAEPKLEVANRAPSPPEPAEREAPAPAPPPRAPEPSLPSEPPQPPGSLKIPRKSGLLERLRARALAGNNPRPPTKP